MEVWYKSRRTCDKGSIGERTSCLRSGLGPLLGEEVVFEPVLLCCRPGDGLALESGVSGLAAGIVSIIVRVSPLHGVFHSSI